MAEASGNLPGLLHAGEARQLPVQEGQGRGHDLGAEAQDAQVLAGHLRDERVAALLERVAALLSPTPTPRDELARALGAPIAQVAGALLELSLTGRAELLPGGLASL